jgi:hypothetical protein
MFLVVAFLTIIAADRWRHKFLRDYESPFDDG